MKIQYNFRLDPELLKELETHSAKMNISASKLIRRAIREYIKNN